MAETNITEAISQLQQSIRQVNGLTPEIIAQAGSHGVDTGMLEQRKAEAEARTTEQRNALFELLNNTQTLNAEERNALQELAKLDTTVAGFLQDNNNVSQAFNSGNIQELIDQVTEAQANVANAGDVRALPDLQSQLAEKIETLESALAGVDDQTLVTLREQLESLPLTENGQEMLVGRYDNISPTTARERNQQEEIASETENMPQLEVTDGNVQTISSTTPNSLSALEGKILFRGVGNYDNSVTILQETLKALDYDLGQFGVDGHYGSATESAVKAFQAAQGLPQDGIVGSQTLAKLQEAMAMKQAQTVSTDTPVIPQQQETTMVEAPNPNAIDLSTLGISENQISGI